MKRPSGEALRPTCREAGEPIHPRPASKCPYQDTKLSLKTPDGQVVRPVGHHRVTSLMTLGAEESLK